MKRLFLLAAGLLFLILLSASGCTEDTVSPIPGAEVSSSCVTCHTDKELLQQLAVEEEEEGSEQTTGEG
ncbi:MAG: hypothetical protein WBC89_09845 [Dehalococcoidia bacterium]